MASAIEELQRAAIDPNLSLTDLLRKALLVAAKLERNDFRSWIEKELYGYRDDSNNLPPYRIVHGIVKANDPLRGWLPISFRDAAMAEKLSKVPMAEPIAELENYHSEFDVLASFHPKAESALRKSIGENVEVARHVSGAAVRAILDIVRNEVLNWTLRLEAAGVTGENYSFTAEEKASAKSVPMHVYNISGPTNISHIGDVHDNANVNIDQNASYKPEQLKALLALVREIESTKELLGLAQDREQELANTLKQLSEYLTKGTAEPKSIRQLLATLRNIVEGASGSLLATGILTQLARFG